jgi:hypothetical protein
MQLVQLQHPRHGRKVALVEGDQLTVLHYFTSVFGLAQRAISESTDLRSLVPKYLGQNQLAYDPIYEGKSDWQLLPPLDHPTDPMHCLVSGTGLTHKASAENRERMHQAEAQGKLTDSMIIYQWGVAGGHPKKGEIGVQPEWFYKGNGTSLKAHGAPLELPAYADDGGEEPEIAGLYVISDAGAVYRVGFATGNEYSDHVMERKNYLYLAPSKLRANSLGPELIVDADFKDVRGKVAVYRGGEEIWSAAVKSGEANMAHSLANLEYHHFKYPNHRVPGQVHVHYFGADAFSFGGGVKLADGDVMEVYWEGFGRALRNPLQAAEKPEQLIDIHSL